MTLERKKEIAAVTVSLLRNLETLILQEYPDVEVETTSKEVAEVEIEKPKIHEPTELEIKVMTSELFRKLGIPAHLKGYGFMKDAILLQIQDGETLEQITKILYPTIARKNKSTPGRVERAIRHAIEVAYVRGNMEIYNEVFGYSISPEKSKPTNSEFLFAVTEYICLKLEKKGAKF